MILQALLLVLSCVILYFGAEFALSAAEKIGKKFNLSPLVVGLVLVGFGTSLPELFVSQLACIRDESAIAIGNIVGSNIANTFLIMGIAAILAPLALKSREIKKQLWLHLALTVIFAVVMLASRFYLASAIVLSIFFIFYLYVAFKDKKAEPVPEEEMERFSPLNYGKLVVGFTLLYIGGELLVSSGKSIATWFNISTYVISAIFVAFGTSFPELVTALLASFRKKDTDLIVGNVIGSNIFNVAFVMASLGGYGVKFAKSFHVELGALLAVSVLMIILSRFSGALNRYTGIFFLLVYAGLVVFWTMN